MSSPASVSSQSPGMAVVPSSHGTGEHFVSSAPASGCGLVHVDRAPFHSLGGSPGPRGCSLGCMQLPVGPHPPGTTLPGTQRAVELQGCSPYSLIHSLNTSGGISVLFRESPVVRSTAGRINFLKHSVCTVNVVTLR